MKIGRPFNQLSKSEYLHCIDNHKKYTDFNTLGLYRSLVEHEKLSLEDKFEIREYAHKHFQKTFDFLQLKDPLTFVEVNHLGEELTEVEYHQAFDQVRKNQQKILNDKRFGHRNFGTYAKHNCGIDACPYNGIMVRQGSWFAEGRMYLCGDKNEMSAKDRAAKVKKERRSGQQIVREDWELDHFN